jgi:uncharacterized protein (DUF362 family)
MKRSIHITRCAQYDLDEIREQIKEHLDKYRKFSDVKGKKILLKINLLGAMEPEKAVTTHPVFVKAVIRELQERGAEVIIGDSPGGLFNKKSLKKAYKATGMIDVAKETGCELNYETGAHEEKFPKGKFTKNFNICDYLRNCDMIIALPKIKTHMFCGLTCASKIMFGAIPGTEKVKYHARFPSTVNFSKMLIDLTDATKVDLFLVDGIIGMDEKGPSQGRPRNVGVIMSGTEHTSIDLQATRIIGLDPTKLPMMVAAKDIGAINFNDDINLTGNGKDYIMKTPFTPAKGVKIASNPPKFLRRLSIYLSTHKPKVSHKKCIGCGICAENCAGNTIKIVNDKAKIRYSNCIRCYCCHELCPYDAIYLTMKESGLVDYFGDIAFNYFMGPRK